MKRDTIFMGWKMLFTCELFLSVSVDSKKYQSKSHIILFEEVLKIGKIFLKENKV